MSRQVTLTGEVVASSIDAVLFEDGDGERQWIPRSVLLDGRHLCDGDTDLVCAEWFAEKKGLS